MQIAFKGNRTMLLSSCFRMPQLKNRFPLFRSMLWLCLRRWTAATAAAIRLRLDGSSIPVLEPSAQIAQLVEHATENRSVAGSIPALGTIFIK